MTYEIMPDEKLSKAMQVVYNVWFRKWSHRSGRMTDTDWDQCLREADAIMEAGRGHNYKVLEAVTMALLQELHARDLGGYPEEKLMEVNS